MLRVRRPGPLVVVRGGEVEPRARLESFSRRRVPTCNGLGEGAVAALSAEIQQPRLRALVLLDGQDEALVEELRAEASRIVALGIWRQEALSGPSPAEPEAR